MGERSGLGQALRAPDFLRLWIGQIISMLGDRLDQMGIVAMATAAGARSVTGLLAMLAVLVIAPQLVMSISAGWLIDRSNRRVVLIASDLGRAALVLSLPLAFTHGGHPAVYVVILAVGTLTALFTPAKAAIIPSLVPAPALAAANGLSSITNVLATLVGSLVGAHLAVWLGVDRGAPPIPFFVVDAATYGVSAYLIWRITVDLRPGRAAGAAAGAGPARPLWSTLRADPEIKWIIISSVLVWVVAAVVYSAVNSFAYVRFARGVIGIGDLQSALGLGMLAGALSAGRFAHRFRPVPWLLATGALLWMFSDSTVWAVAVLAVVGIGVCAAAMFVMVDTGVQMRVPDGSRGRVFGLAQQLTAIGFIVPSLALRADAHVDSQLPLLLRMTSSAVLAWAVLWAMRGRSAAGSPCADWGVAWLNRLDRVNRSFCRVFHGLKAEGARLPPSGPVLLVANHISGLDPILLLAALPRPLRFLIDHDEYDRWWLKWVLKAMRLIPVVGGHPGQAYRAARQALSQGEVVALFPQGGIYPPGQVGALKAGVAHMARRAGVPVVPVYVAPLAGSGQKVAAVFVPNRAARLTIYPPLYCDSDDIDGFLKRLEPYLAGEVAAPEG